MNLRRMVNKLQTALIAKGRYITVNQKQFYSDDIERVVTLYEVKESIVDENGATAKTIKILKTYSLVEVVETLAKIYGGG